MIFQTPPEGSLQNTHERVRLYQGSTARYERYQSIKQSLLRSVENKELFIVLQPQYGDAGNIILNLAVEGGNGSIGTSGAQSPAFVLQSVGGGGGLCGRSAGTAGGYAGGG